MQNPILIDVAKELETERLILRMPQPGDGAAVNEAIRASIKEMKPWLPFVQTTPTVEETESNLREAYSHFVKRTSLRYLIFRKDNNEFVGSTGYHNIDWDVPKLELGYWIDTRYAGKGYMTEAIQKLTEYAQHDLKMRRVVIQCESENKRSRSIPEKLGFELEGILKNDDLSVDGKRLTDTCIYAKVR
ncbi:GNAT family N-acetyltransferase [Pseudalkalibacillus berkeleyi]|uniref:GNAT family N-acetyltransferase n=1 Tax=Pseudalkalibacillus berkeleyi TaxID=1069813 RepID=A0ABS9H2J6_9BACL|nr:GNAT family N-acetyltransferase [Pseudalkalibacillus berkeleyi]MCF6138281.1 GNAT family N-acetyltransferase [Pseudalkalibacillus berkeleyi]